MIYTIAAYSITLGVLGLYLVLLQHRHRQCDADLAHVRGEAPADPSKGFNVGAALVAPVWLVAHGNALAGLLLLVPWLVAVPLWMRGALTLLLFVALVPVAAGAALGFVGNRIAAAKSGVRDPVAFSSSQLPWALAGVVLYAFVLPWAFYFSALSD